MPEITPELSDASCETSLPRRRNGKQQSCEPCRIAKAACDHGLPKCQRCIRKGIEVRCNYHPAPMTKAPGAKPTSSISKPDHHLPKHRQTLISASAASELLLSLSEQKSLDLPTVKSPVPKWHTSAATPQFLGRTSYTAVFQENQDNLGETWDQSAVGTVEMPEVTRCDLDSAMDVLRRIPDRDTCIRLLDCHNDAHDGPLHQQTINYCLESLWET